MRSFWLAFLPLAGTVGTLAALDAAGVGEPGLLVLGGALCLRTARRTTPSFGAGLAQLVLVVVATAGLGLLFAHSTAAADGLYLLVFVAARLAWRLGPTAEAAGRALLIPLVTLFIAPQVALADRPLVGMAQVLLACVVATVWSALPARLWPPGPPSVRPLAAAVHRRVGRPGMEARRRRVARAALELDASLPPDATEARLAVVAVEHAVETGGDAEEALAKAATAIDGLPRSEPAPAGAAASERAAAIRSAVRTRLALQSTAALALAFTVGQLAFGRHWPWVVITVLAVSLRATSRGEVAVTAVERLLGAAAGTVVATAVGALATPPPVTATLVILAVLGAGMALRPYGYAWWAAAMTASLSLLYGLLGEPAGLSVLGERLLAIVVGGACAVLPAALLAPVRTRAAVRRRLAVALRTVGAALRSGPTVGTTRDADRALDQLRLGSRPLRLVRRSAAETGWALRLLGSGPALHAALLDPAAGTRASLGATVRSIAAEVRDG